METEFKNAKNKQFNDFDCDVESLKKSVEILEHYFINQSITRTDKLLNWSDKGISQIYIKMWHKAISYIILDVQVTILSIFAKNIT